MDFEDTEEYLMNQLLFLFQLILSGWPRVQTVQTPLRFRHPGLVTKIVNISLSKFNQESGLKTCDSRDIVVSDIFVKVNNISSRPGVRKVKSKGWFN